MGELAVQGAEGPGIGLHGDRKTAFLGGDDCLSDWLCHGGRLLDEGASFTWQERVTLLRWLG